MNGVFLLCLRPILNTSSSSEQDLVDLLHHSSCKGRCQRYCRRALQQGRWPNKGHRARRIQVRPWTNLLPLHRSHRRDFPSHRQGCPQRTETQPTRSQLPTYFRTRWRTGLHERSRCHATESPYFLAKRTQMPLFVRRRQPQETPPR